MTDPFWVISTSPVSTIRRAARRTGSIKSRQSSSDRARATSEGQIVASLDRASSKDRILSSSSLSVALTLRRRQVSLQYLTSSQFFSHFLRHSIRRPHDAHTLSAGCAVEVRREWATDRQ